MAETGVQLETGEIIGAVDCRYSLLEFE